MTVRMSCLNINTKTEKGLIFKFQRHALHDGPGIRTLVFFKGCPLRCLWCFNPESQEKNIEVVHYEEKCIGCNLCLKVCPIPGAIEVENGKKKINRFLCNNCAKCTKVCMTGGMTAIGSYKEVDEVFAVIEKDRIFYENSGGGVTLSGGEVTLQGSFATKLLKKCKEKGIHTAIETCGFTKWENFQKILQYTDLVFFDIKVIDSQKHKEYTGVSNDLILDNARKIANLGVPLVIRIPIIPGYTDSDNNLLGIAKFIKEELKGVKRIDVLPYEQIGISKYKRLGRKYFLESVDPPSKSHMEQVKEIFKSYGFNVQIGG